MAGIIISIKTDESGPKISAKIKIYIRIRAKLLCWVGYEIPCRIMKNVMLNFSTFSVGGC
jgi:hypothetical protein